MDLETEQSDVVVDINKLSLIFETSDGPIHALSDIDLSIKSGEFVSLIGPSGCGKTTLLRVLADLEKHSSGGITVNGMSPDQARQQNAYGYVFQAPALYPWRTVKKNVVLPLEVLGYSKEQQNELASQYLDLVNLTGFENKYPWQLSGECSSGYRLLGHSVLSRNSSIWMNPLEPSMRLLETT